MFFAFLSWPANPRVHLWWKNYQENHLSPRNVLKQFKKSAPAPEWFWNHEAFEFWVFGKGNRSVPGKRTAVCQWDFGYPSCSQGFKQELPLVAVVWAFSRVNMWLKHHVMSWTKNQSCEISCHWWQKKNWLPYQCMHTWLYVVKQSALEIVQLFLFPSTPTPRLLETSGNMIWTYKVNRSQVVWFSMPKYRSKSSKKISPHVPGGNSADDVLRNCARLIADGARVPSREMHDPSFHGATGLGVWRFSRRMLA